MTLDSNNIFSNIPNNPEEELFEELFKGKNVRIERIISNGQSSPAGFWYEQVWDEWVILLTGSAELEFLEGEIVNLIPGDYIYIPASKRHRVNSTNIEEISIWLAIHFAADI